jgi:hypothetical protein
MRAQLTESELQLTSKICSRAGWNRSSGANGMMALSIRLGMGVALFNTTMVQQVYAFTWPFLTVQTGACGARGRPWEGCRCACVHLCLSL